MEEERAAGLGNREGGEWRWRWRGVCGEGPLRTSFQDGFYGVTSNADLPRPLPPSPSAPSVRPLVPPSPPRLTTVYSQVDSNWLFFHKAETPTFNTTATGSG